VEIWFAIVGGHAAVAGTGVQSAAKIESRSAFLIGPADYARSLMRLLLLALLVAAPAQAPPFDYSVARLSPAQLPQSWRAGCPVSPAQLRRVRLTYWGFDARAHSGSLDVHAEVVQDVVQVFRKLYAARFPVRRMRPIEAYGADDDRSMAADNTSGFNCRFVEGTRRWSAHASGKAVDVNPVENPYLAGGRVQPPAGRVYLDRTKVRPGMAMRGGILVRAFAAVGWSWGGRWRGTPDYQHFSASGG
jgi:D-alanyl-D-alanine carboxypeptidase-like protein